MEEKKKRVPGFIRIPGFTILGLGVVAGFGALVMVLWNALMPEIFGLATIGYWQALGISLLGRLLIGGGFGGHGKQEKSKHKKHWRSCGPMYNRPYDDAYEDWWEKEGEQQFEDFMKKAKDVQ